MQEVAPCHLFKLKNRCYERTFRGHPFTYRLLPARGHSVLMIGFQKGASFREVHPLEGDCSIEHLGELSEAAPKQLVDWCSTWGLVGGVCENWNEKRLQRQLECEAGMALYHRVAETPWGVSPYGEPVELIREAARTARATTMLYLALKQKQSMQRAYAVSQILEKGAVVVDGGESGPCLREDRVRGVSIGWSEDDFPCHPYQFVRRGWEGLHYLLDTYLNSSLKLVCDPGRHPERPRFYWRVHSLMGALYLKLLRSWRKQRWCVVCNASIAHLRTQAITCSNRCRQTRKRRKEGPSRS